MPVAKKAIVGFGEDGRDKIVPVKYRPKPLLEPATLLIFDNKSRITVITGRSGQDV